MQGIARVPTIYRGGLQRNAAESSIGKTEGLCMENLKSIIEALIFVSEAPLSAARIKDVLGDCEKSEIMETIRELVREYGDSQRGLHLEEVAGGFQFRTNPDMSSWVRKLKGTKPAALSQPAMETLAIIAYRQPVVKADIEKMRGVDVSGPLRGLLDKKLVKMVGRKDVPGKPMLYGTTKKFLEVFNLNDLSALPTLRELKELQEAHEAEESQSKSDTYDFEDLKWENSHEQEQESQDPPELPENSENRTEQSEDEIKKEESPDA